MHLAEGILSNLSNPGGGAAVLAGGWALTAVGTALGLRAMDQDRVPRVAVLCAAFFVISLIHVPLGPVAVHLVLNGLVGIVLGWAAFPALLVALAMQAVLFQVGGLTTLGINTFSMAAPAVLCSYVFGPVVRAENDRLAALAATAAGAVGMLTAGLIVAASLLVAGEAFVRVSQLSLAAHVVLAVVEGGVTCGAVLFLRKVYPSLLQGAAAPPESGSWEISNG